LPAPVKDGNSVVAWRVGVLGNMLIAAIASVVSWGLYGPFTASFVIGSPPAGQAATAITLTVGTLASALLLGYGGARWLTNEVDKRILKATASAAAAGAADPNKAQQIANSTPTEGFRIATGQSD
jgi:hypothetical protein